MSVNLGRVAYVEKGAYDSLTEYQSKDVVAYNSGSYVYIGDTPATGKLPTDTDYWQVLLDPTAMNENIAEMDGVKQEALAAAATASEKAQEASIAANTANTAAEAADNARLSIADELNKKAPAIFVDASGDMVHITDGAAMPVQSLVSHIEPVQSGSGDPSPENVRPISGWDSVTATRTGKNLVDISETITFTQGLTHYCNIPAGNYIVSCENVSATGAKKPALEFVDKNRGTIAVIDNLTGGTAKTVNLDRDAARIVFYANGYSFANSAGINATIEGFMVSKVGGAYEPYQSQTLTAELPETLYGFDENWTTGLVTVTHHAMVFDGTETITRHPNAANFENTTSFYVSIPEAKLGQNTSVSSHFKQTGTGNGAWDLNAVSGLLTDYTEYRRKYFTWGSVGQTLAEFKAWLAEQYAAGTPVTLVYKLEEPYTIQLTPQQLETLKGTNNIWSNAGETEVTYIADTKMYIDQKIAAIAAAIV